LSSFKNHQKLIVSEELFFVEHALQHSVIIISVMLYKELIEPFISFSFV